MKTFHTTRNDNEIKAIKLVWKGFYPNGRRIYIIHLSNNKKIYDYESQYYFWKSLLAK